MDSTTTDFWSSFDWSGWAVKLLMAVAILVVTWIVARIVRWAFSKLTERVGLLQRAGGDGNSVGDSLGQIASLLVWLFGLVAILQLFALERVLEPIQSLLTGVMGFLPNLIGAAFVFFVGSLIAKIVRQLVETTLSTINFDTYLNRTGADEVTGNQTLSRTLATVLWALIMIVVAIASLQILGISAISDPAQQMLQAIFTAIPNIIAAALILGVGFVIARFAGDILLEILQGFGTDRAASSLGLLTEGRSLSSVLTKIAQVAIMLFFGVMATRMLDFPEVTAILNEVLALGGRVLFGAVIIGAGFYVANLLASMVEGGLATQVIRYATLVLFVAMGLSYMGIADSIIQLAFGSLVVGGALAAAIAFGLGGRDAAARVLERAEQQGSSELTS